MIERIYSTGLDYLRDPAEIYRESFAMIEREADLSRFAQSERTVAVRMIHACGMVDLVNDIAMSKGAVGSGASALVSGATILCDAEMVARGIIETALPQGAQVVCRLNDPRVRQIADQAQTTRSAAQVDLWTDRLDGSVVVIGNAPTALFRLLETLAEIAARPALVVGIPVGFVGAAESKEALLASPVPFITVRGRRGGSAIAAAAVNALAAIATGGGS